VAIGCGLAPQIQDPYEMAIASIDEAIRNVVAVGADPSRLAILDNFCWPSVDDPLTMGTLVRACEACRDAALAFGVPFISGKDSLHNQFTDTENSRVIRIPNTLLISAIGVIEDVRKCVTMDLKRAGNVVLCLYLHDRAGELSRMLSVHRAVSSAMARGLIQSCHDCSDGGFAVAAAEMCIACGLGISLQEPTWGWFEENTGTYLLEVPPDQVDEIAVLARQHGCGFARCGQVIDKPNLELGGQTLSVQEMTRAWRGTLDW
jgi:phosphoribosylformylglycinamidine synthase